MAKLDLNSGETMIGSGQMSPAVQWAEFSE
jgi:hypothetical protein